MCMWKGHKGTAMVTDKCVCVCEEVKIQVAGKDGGGEW